MSSERFENTNAGGALEIAMDAALQEQPTVMIPVDFAARVAAKAATMPQRSHAPRAHYARTIAISLSALLVVALFVLAPHAQPSFSSVAFDVELMALGLLCGLVYVLTQTRNESL